MDTAPACEPIMPPVPGQPVGQATVRVDTQLCFALYAASRASTAAYRPFLSELGLTYPRYLVMLVLWEKDDISVGELGAWLYLDTGTLTPLLKKLKASGLIARARDGRDERTVRITLTDKGRELRGQAAQIASTLACRLALPLEQVEMVRSEVWKIFGLLTAKESKTS